jgi:DNA replication protein DnaC
MHVLQPTALADRAGLVVLDDVGADRGTGLAQEALHIVVSEREATRVPLIITSNLSIQEIGSLFDARIASRLAGGVVLKLTGADRRLASRGA